MRESIGISNVTRPFNAASLKLKFSIKNSEKKINYSVRTKRQKQMNALFEKKKVLAKKKRIED